MSIAPTIDEDLELVIEDETVPTCQASHRVGVALVVGRLRLDIPGLDGSMGECSVTVEWWAHHSEHPNPIMTCDAFKKQVEALSPKTYTVTFTPFG
jgi:hypothetical protein